MSRLFAVRIELFSDFCSDWLKNPNNPDSLIKSKYADHRWLLTLRQPRGDVPGYFECVLGRIPVTPFENKDLLLI